VIILKLLVKKIFNMLGLELLSVKSYNKMLKKNQDSLSPHFLEFYKSKSLEIIENISESHSQLKQDLFILAQSNFKKNGFFVEFGATDGVKLSNTYLLERKFNWTGILAEPARCWHQNLKSNRKAIIETRCVWEKTGSIVEFNEAFESELSTVSSFSDSDLHSLSRKSIKKYNVETISLLDLLIKHNAPHIIDYLSIDTEGSELSIMKAFDFNQYKFKIITCEHNYSQTREEIYNLLINNGYVRIFEEMSDFDDWYILKNQ
jgi:FkbM family methyltransferase